MEGATIEGAINQLELLFNRTEADLSYISRKLETEFASEYESLSAQRLNPHTALARIEDIRAQLASLVSRSVEVESRKAAVTAALKSKCQQISGGVAQLEVLGSSDLPTAVDAKSADMIEIGRAAHAAAPAVEKRPAAPPKPERGSDAFEPLTVDEFESVSTLVRGRCKLDDVNTVYETIFKAFSKAKGSDKPLTVKDMAAMGLKITGQSGEAKLKTLRQLRIITINNRDKSVMLSR